MPSHQERVRRNYPEGVPAFPVKLFSFCYVNGQRVSRREADNLWQTLNKPAEWQARELERQGEAWFGHIPEPGATSEVPRPPLTATEPICPKCGESPLSGVCCCWNDDIG